MSVRTKHLHAELCHSLLISQQKDVFVRSVFILHRLKVFGISVRTKSSHSNNHSPCSSSSSSLSRQKLELCNKDVGNICCLSFDSPVLNSSKPGIELAVAEVIINPSSLFISGFCPFAALEMIYVAPLIIAASSSFQNQVQSELIVSTFSYVKWQCPSMKILSKQ